MFCTLFRNSSALWTRATCGLTNDLLRFCIGWHPALQPLDDIRSQFSQKLLLSGWFFLPFLPSNLVAATTVSRASKILHLLISKCLIICVFLSVYSYCYRSVSATLMFFGGNIVVYSTYTATNGLRQLMTNTIICDRAFVCESGTVST